MLLWSHLMCVLLVRLSYVNSLVGHEGPVQVIATSPTLGDIATVCTTSTTLSSERFLLWRDPSQSLFHFRVRSVCVTFVDC